MKTKVMKVEQASVRAYQRGFKAGYEKGRKYQVQWEKDNRVVNSQLYESNRQALLDWDDQCRYGIRTGRGEGTGRD